MFKKRARGGGAIRKRKADSDSNSSDDETQVVKKEKKVDYTNHLIQRSKSHGRKDGANPDSSSDDDSEDELRSGYRSKKTGEREGSRDMGATATSQIETSKENDATAIYEKSLQIDKETRGQVDDKVYRGMNNYSKFYEKKDTTHGNAASSHKGPIRAPDHIRVSVRWDYQPDLCKDFKETGFCGFGDSCKFLHDRTDYKLGWQMEMESTKRGQDDSDENWEIPDDEEHLPFKCLICRESFVDPVITKCRHYFCEKCALEQFKKNKRCYVCSENTMGVFQPAKEIIARMKATGEDSD